MNNRIKALAVAIAGISAAGGVQAMENSSLEEIVVTAQRRAEKLIDVPMSITAISGDDLTSAGIQTALDLSYSVPSLAVMETGPGAQTIVIRGVSGLRGTSSLVGVYLDEIPLTSFKTGFFANSPDTRLIDLDRVEVLKGPQGTLFGEGAAGGVVRLITKDPDLTGFGGDLSARFYDTEDGGWSEGVSGVLNIPVGETFGIRVAAAYEDTSGWIDQPTIGRKDINDSEVKHARVKVMYIPIPQLRIEGTVEVHRNDVGASNVVNQQPYDESNFRQAWSLEAPTNSTDDYDVFNLTATYDFGFAELLSSTSYAQFDRIENFTQLTGDPVNPFVQIWTLSDSDTSVASQELRLTSSPGGRLNWTLGTLFKDAESIGTAISGTNAVLPNGTIVSGIGAGAVGTNKSQSLAVFADGSYDVTSRLAIGGGLRYFQDDRETINVGSGTFEKLTYRAFAKLQATESVNLYISGGTGFRSGGFNTPFSVGLGAPASFDPEKITSYEAGTKMSLMGGRMRIDTALFYSKYTDMVEDVLVTESGAPVPVQYTANGQDGEIRGIEVSVDWRVTEHLTARLAGDVTDSKITWVDPANLQKRYAVGDSLNWVPDFGLSANLKYGFQWSSSVAGWFDVGWNMKGESHYFNRNNALVPGGVASAPEAGFLDLSIGSEWSSGWGVTLFGKNLLDERGIITASTNGFTAQARPRSIGIVMRKQF